MMSFYSLTIVLVVFFICEEVLFYCWSYSQKTKEDVIGSILRSRRDRRALWLFGDRDIESLSNVDLFIVLNEMIK